MLRALAPLAAILLLSACALATDAPQENAPNAIQLNCSGSLSSMDDCVKEAKAQCPQGYRVLNTDAPKLLPHTNINFRKDTPDTPIEDRHYFGQQRGMLIVCDAAAAKPAKKPRKKAR